MDKKQIEEYLAKYNIANKEQLSLHIEQLKRNTSPNVRLINELEWIMADGYFGEEKPYFTTTVTPISQFFSAEKERVKNIFSTNVQEALQRAEEHQAQFGRKENEEADRFSETIFNGQDLEKERSDINEYLEEKLKFLEKYVKTENKIRQEKVKTVLDDILKDDTIFNNNRAEKDTMEFLKDTGVKYNNGKPQISLLFKQFPKALEAVAKCSEYGHEKYKDTDQDYLNYQRVEGGSQTYADAGLRHRLFVKGTTDIDSQLPHSYHTCWNALAELELILKNR